MSTVLLDWQRLVNGVVPLGRGARKWMGAGSLAMVMLLSACHQAPQPVEESRPVRLMTVTSENSVAELVFSGDIRPRIESALGFRVPGKMVARLIDVGAKVHRGQVLARLDPQDLVLAQQAAQAQWQSAQTERAMAKADLQRFSELQAKGFISMAQLDRYRTADVAAQARLEQAEANYRSQANQSAYSTLVAPEEGVVTAIHAEMGQVLAAGQPVVTVAREDEREVRFGIPEDQLPNLREKQAVQIKLWAAPQQRLMGYIREISPTADRTTRTYIAKVAMPDAPGYVKLGMTATVLCQRPMMQQGTMEIPLSAVLLQENQAQAWVFNRATGTVSPVAVVLGAARGNDVQVVSGLQNGQQIVTAGVRFLRQGMKVRPLEKITPAAGSGTSPSDAPASRTGV